MLSAAELDDIERRLAAMSPDELLEVELNLMDLVLEKKMDEGKIVFSEVENGLLN